MKQRIVYLIFILPFGFFLCLLLSEAYLHIFYDMTLEGKITAIDPPGGEYQFSSYSIEYFINNAKFTTHNTGAISEDLIIGDSLTLLVDSGNYSQAVIKDSHKGLYLPIILLLLLETILFYGLYTTFQKKIE